MPSMVSCALRKRWGAFEAASAAAGWLNVAPSTTGPLLPSTDVSEKSCALPMTMRSIVPVTRMPWLGLTITLAAAWRLKSWRPVLRKMPWLKCRAPIIVVLGTQ